MGRKTLDCWRTGRRPPRVTRGGTRPPADYQPHTITQPVGAENVTNPARLGTNRARTRNAWDESGKSRDESAARAITLPRPRRSPRRSAGDRLSRTSAARRQSVSGLTPQAAATRSHSPGETPRHYRGGTSARFPRRGARRSARDTRSPARDPGRLGRTWDATASGC